MGGQERQLKMDKSMRSGGFANSPAFLRFKSGMALVLRAGWLPPLSPALRTSPLPNPPLRLSTLRVLRVRWRTPNAERRTAAIPMVLASRRTSNAERRTPNGGNYLFRSVSVAGGVLSSASCSRRGQGLAFRLTPSGTCCCGRRFLCVFIVLSAVY